MDFKVKQLMWIDPKLSPELQAEAKERLERAAKGGVQNFIGDKRKEMVQDFLDALDPERRKKLEADILTLHTIEDESRFRTQLVLMLVDAFFGGVEFGQTRNG